MHCQLTIQLKSQPQSTPCSPPKQHEVVNPEPTGSTSPDSMDEGLQANDDPPAPLRKLKEYEEPSPLRYQNFVVWQNDTPPSTLDWWVGLCICLYILSCLHTVFLRGTVWTTLYLNHHWSARLKMIPGIGGDTTNVDYGGFSDGGSGPKDIWYECNCPIVKAKVLPIEAPWVPGQYNPGNKVQGETMRQHKKERHLAHSISGGNSTVIY